MKIEEKEQKVICDRCKKEASHYMIINFRERAFFFIPVKFEIHLCFDCVEEIYNHLIQNKDEDKL